MSPQRIINKNTITGQKRRQHKWFALTLCIFFAVCALPLLAAAPRNSNTMSTNAISGDEAAIRALEQNFSDAVHAGDVDRIMANYQHGPALAYYDFDRRQDHLGWDAYRNDWQHFLSLFNGPITFQIYDMNITTAGNVAYGRGYQHVAGQTANGKRVDYVVQVTDVYRKTNGKWLIAAEHVSIPVDLTSGKAYLQRVP